MPKPVLTIPTVTPAGAIVGRPRKPVPPDASQRIAELAADGWSVVGIAWKLGTTPAVLRRWLDEDEALREALALGRERERHALHNKLFRQAMEDDTKESLRAAMFLLNTKHGYRNSEPDSSARVNVVINLPAARPMSDFIEVSNADGTETHQISGTRS